MRESFLHYVWRHRLYRFVDLTTVTGQSLKIIHPGFPHTDAGPDFKQAIVKIDDITWAGDVEIHILSSDWLKHGHQQDQKYQSVILHVVYDNDMDIYRSSQEKYPTLELKEHIPDDLLNRYREMSLAENELPCRSLLSEIDSLRFSSFLSAMTMERLLKRQKLVLDIVDLCTGNWEEAFFRLLVSNFGFKTNTPAFELLSKSIPYSSIVKHAGSKLQVYALIFGQAGMLQTEMDDPYFQSLQSEYHYLQYKYKLVPLSPRHWSYLRLRPRNFPCIRLAQLSELIHTVPDLFHRLIHEELGEHELEKLICCTPDVYWQTHYKFGKPVKARCITLGKDSLYLLLINTMVPLLFSYAAFHGKEELQIRAVSMLEDIPFEENRITRYYKEAGFPAKGALYSQAILELKARYCTSKKCLDCPVGSFVLRNHDKVGRSD